MNVSVKRQNYAPNYFVRFSVLIEGYETKIMHELVSRHLKIVKDTKILGLWRYSDSVLKLF